MSIFDRPQKGYTDEEFIARGKHAQMLLNDEILNSILEDAEFSLMLNWSETDGSEVEKRERAWMGIQSLSIFRGQLQAAVNDGAVAETRYAAELEEQE